ncbi:hypothetical protein ACFPPD_09920 [Cohnella suwonensis]|uniref:Uncharacterized protein n=1 Tax=Cohnella suwonensis TaxID=696072 RepID=A0ABW0LSZ9_9BACL
MYPKVDFPKKKLTQEWRDRAFAPLRRYLERQHPDEAEQMLSYLTFIGNEEGMFMYKNSITKGRITFAQNGALLEVMPSALEYDFEWLTRTPKERPPREERFVHPNINRWIKRELTAAQDAKYGEDVRIFLQEYWGPIVNYDFNDLRSKYPFKPHCKQPRYTLFVYPANMGKKLGFQFTGDEIVEYRWTKQDHNEYLTSQRAAALFGWRVIDVFREMLDDELPEFLERIIDIAEPTNPASNGN